MTDELAEGLHHEMDQMLRAVLAAGLQMAEMRARRQRQGAEAARDSASDQAQDTERRLRAERQAAGVIWAGIGTEEWWREATPERIVNTWQLASAHAEVDPAAAEARETMATQLQDRHRVEAPGIDTPLPEPSPGDRSSAKADTTAWDAYLESLTPPESEAVADAFGAQAGVEGSDEPRPVDVTAYSFPRDIKEILADLDPSTPIEGLSDDNLPAPARRPELGAELGGQP